MLLRGCFPVVRTSEPLKTSVIRTLAEITNCAKGRTQQLKVNLNETNITIENVVQ